MYSHCLNRLYIEFQCLIRSGFNLKEAGGNYITSILFLYLRIVSIQYIIVYICMHPIDKPLN